MTVRRGLPYLLALMLGVVAALLIACGGGTKSGIPSASAGQLKSEIEDVRQATDDGRCAQVPEQLKQVDDSIDVLPASTDEELVSALRDGADKLRQVAIKACNSTPTQTTTTETTPTETTTTDTTTTPTDTTPTDTTPTETTPTEQPPPPEIVTSPAPIPPPVPEPVPPPPPATPGGGTPPEIPQP